MCVIQHTNHMGKSRNAVKPLLGLKLLLLGFVEVGVLGCEADDGTQDRG